MPRRSPAIGFIVILLLSGCAQTLQTVDDPTLHQQLALLEDGKTTKQDILLRFGIPSGQLLSEKGTFLTVREENKEDKLLEILSREAEFSLVLVFDDQGTLDRHDLRRIMP